MSYEDSCLFNPFMAYPNLTYCSNQTQHSLTLLHLLMNNAKLTPNGHIRRACDEHTIPYTYRAYGVYCYQTLDVPRLRRSCNGFLVPSGTFGLPGWLVDDARGFLRDAQSQDPWPEHGFETHINTATHDCFMVVHGRRCMETFPSPSTTVYDKGNRCNQ